jgi:hypothetical protein
MQTILLQSRMFKKLLKNVWKGLEMLNCNKIVLRGGKMVEEDKKM